MRATLVLVSTWLLLRLALLCSGGSPGEAHTLVMGDHRAAVLLFRGAQPAASLLVVSHGGLASKESLMAVCWEARRRGADCVAVDALGHGGSSAQPNRGRVAAMRQALGVVGAKDEATGEVLLGPYERVRFLGHSMGAYLGRGEPYPCNQSVALGQETHACPDQRVVWGTLHRALGLGEDGYLLSHVLECWTPWVIDRALDLVLPATAHHRTLIAVQVLLCWLSFVTMMAAGVAAARLFRRRVTGSPALRGLGGAAIVWLALDLGAWRTLWFLTPTQPGDAVVVGVVVAAAMIAAGVLRVLGLRAPWIGLLLGSGFAGLAAYGLYRALYIGELGGLLLLLPTMLVPLVPWVLSWERLSRTKSADLLETAAFTATLLSLFVALLLPG